MLNHAMRRRERRRNVLQRLALPPALVAHRLARSAQLDLGATQLAAQRRAHRFGVRVPLARRVCACLLCAVLRGARRRELLVEESAKRPVTLVSLHARRRAARLWHRGRFGLVLRGGRWRRGDWLRALASERDGAAW